MHHHSQVSSLSSALHYITWGVTGKRKLLGIVAFSCLPAQVETKGIKGSSSKPDWGSMRPCLRHQNGLGGVQKLFVLLFGFSVLGVLFCFCFLFCLFFCLCFVFASQKKTLLEQESRFQVPVGSSERRKSWTAGDTSLPYEGRNCVGNRPSCRPEAGG